MAARENIQNFLHRNINQGTYQSGGNKGKVIYSGTQETYKQQCEQFVSWMKEKGLPRTMRTDKALLHAREYVKELESKGLSAHSTHTTISALAKGFKVELKEIGEVRRGVSQKGRVGTGVRNVNNARVVDFARVVGIRQQEYAALTGKDLVERSGRLYVVVRKGKGGKYQEQLIAPQNEALVKSYFAGVGANEKVFSIKEINSAKHANLHALRRENAQKMYRFYHSLGNEERADLKRQLEERFAENRKKAGKFNADSMERPYWIRNQEIKEQISQNGIDVSHGLDRLALMAVAVFHLSHYREGVVVQNYLR